MENVDCRFIIISGAASGSVTKSAIVASIASLLRSAGMRVTLLKLDPTLENASATNNEEYVLSDGTSVNVDFGTYVYKIFAQFWPCFFGKFKLREIRWIATYRSKFAHDGGRSSRSASKCVWRGNERRSNKRRDSCAHRFGCKLGC